LREWKIEVKVVAALQFAIISVRDKHSE